MGGIVLVRQIVVTIGACRCRFALHRVALRLVYVQ